MKVIMSINAFRILAAALVAAGIAACNKDNGAIDLRQTVEKDVPVEFSAYGATMPTKGVSYSADAMLGHWVDSTSTYVPGTGIGVFAFYQKAKSNGYPTNYNKYTGDPNFMYNQKLERTSADGETFSFTYTPRKYWPNNVNDQLSFFAYAPYDEATAWEDMRLKTDLNATEFRRHYWVEEEVKDQFDYTWANPHLNLKKGDVTGPIHFTFKHLFSRISVSAKVNVETASIYVTVDRVDITGDFTTAGDFIYTPADGLYTWDNLEVTPSATYTPFKAKTVIDPESGEPVYKTFRVTPTVRYVHGDDGFIFVMPGTQDITLSAVVSQRSSTTAFVKSYTITRTFPAMQLEENKAYNFLLNITLTPVTFTGTVDAEWSTSVENYTSHDNGQSWTH